MRIPLVAASTVAVAACMLSFAPATHAAPGRGPVPEVVCNLPLSKTLIIWRHAPGAEDMTYGIPESDIYTCRPMLEVWRASQPKGPGYCSKIAWSGDNPHWIPLVTPAAPLLGVVDQVGDC